MKKYLQKVIVFLLFLYLIFIPRNSLAQEYYCQAGGPPGAECTYNGTDGNCNEPPCPSGDCCLQNYQLNGDCPISLSCIPPTPTPTSAPGEPTPTTNPSTCPTNYYCDSVPVPAATCPNSAGITQSCTSSSQPSGNCCRPSAGIYGCAWYGDGCHAEISGYDSGFPYTCQNNYGHCDENDEDCTQCESFSTSESCLGSNPQICVEQNETIGYMCSLGITGCQPCFEWNEDPASPFYNPLCNPPFYQTIGECDPAGTGQCSAPFIIPTPTPYVPPIYCLSMDPEKGGTRDPDTRRIWTALGCVRTTTVGGFTVDFLSLGLAIGGGIALLMIAIAGIIIKTSVADPQRVQMGWNLAFGALAAILMMVFSVFMLRFIGVDVLHIPGL